MNTKLMGFSVAVACCVALVGCSTETVVTMQDGTQYVTKSVPETRTRDGFYEFEDVSGKQVRVRADDVATIKKED